MRSFPRKECGRSQSAQLALWALHALFIPMIPWNAQPEPSQWSRDYNSHLKIPLDEGSEVGVVIQTCHVYLDWNIQRHWSVAEQ
jgi:hypothetical protein